MSQGWQEAEHGGHPVRHFPLAVSAAALALGWARQEEAPAGATVVVDREISPLGRIGKVWPRPPEETLACAVVLRPPLPAEEADAVWLAGGLAAAVAASATSGHEIGTWWPDSVVAAQGEEEVGHVKAEVQLGPGRVRSAVVTVRLDLGRLGLGADQRTALLEALLDAFDEGAAALEEGGGGLATPYDERCLLLGKRVKIALLPKGATRGQAARVDRLGRLELESSTGMIERIGVDSVRTMEIV